MYRICMLCGFSADTLKPQRLFHLHMVNIAKAKLAKIKEQGNANSRIAPDSRDDVLDMDEGE